MRTPADRCSLGKASKAPASCQGAGWPAGAGRVVWKLTEDWRARGPATQGRTSNNGFSRPAPRPVTSASNCIVALTISRTGTARSLCTHACAVVVLDAEELLEDALAELAGTPGPRPSRRFAAAPGRRGRHFARRLPILARAASGAEPTVCSSEAVALCTRWVYHVRMPTYSRVGPFRFFFYAAWGEPPHVHVERDDCEGFWLDPSAWSEPRFRGKRSTESRTGRGASGAVVGGWMSSSVVESREAWLSTSR